MNAGTKHCERYLADSGRASRAHRSVTDLIKFMLETTDRETKDSSSLRSRRMTIRLVIPTNGRNLSQYLRCRVCAATIQRLAQRRLSMIWRAQTSLSGGGKHEHRLLH